MRMSLVLAIAALAASIGIRPAAAAPTAAIPGPAASSPYILPVITCDKGWHYVPAQTFHGHVVPAHCARDFRP